MVSTVLWLTGVGYLTGGDEIARAALSGFPTVPVSGYPGGIEQCFKDRQSGRAGINEFDCFDDRVPIGANQYEAVLWLKRLVLTGLGVPLLVLGGGYVAAWALAGFRS